VKVARVAAWGFSSTSPSRVRSELPPPMNDRVCLCNPAASSTSNVCGCLPHVAGIGRRLLLANERLRFSRAKLRCAWYGTCCGHPGWLLPSPSSNAALIYCTEHPMPTLGLSMIAKNEAHTLRDCLASVRDVVSQIVIADTGPSDGTFENAREFGATARFSVPPAFTHSSSNGSDREASRTCFRTILRLQRVAQYLGRGGTKPNRVDVARTEEG
jgi:hypothetical protein